MKYTSHSIYIISHSKTIFDFDALRLFYWNLSLSKFMKSMLELKLFIRSRFIKNFLVQKSILRFFIFALHKFYVFYMPCHIINLPLSIIIINDQFPSLIEILCFKVIIFILIKCKLTFYWNFFRFIQDIIAQQFCYLNFRRNNIFLLLFKLFLVFVSVQFVSINLMMYS